MGLTRTNPFYTNYLVVKNQITTQLFITTVIFIEHVPNDLVFCYQEPGSKGHVMEDVGRKTSEVNLDTIFVTPPAFQSSPLDLEPEIKTVNNGAQLSESQKDLFPALTHDRMQGLFQTSTLAQNASANGDFSDITLNSPDLFKPIPAQRRSLSKSFQLKSSDRFKDEGIDLSQAAKGEDLLHAERTREVNLFDKSPSIFEDALKSPENKENDPFASPQPAVANPFYTATANEADLFQAVPDKSGDLFHVWENKDPTTKGDFFGMSSKENLDIFSPSSANTVDPFPSPIARDLFQDVSSLDEPFGASKQYNPFHNVSNGTPDIFQTLPAKTNGEDIFQINPSNTASKATYSAPSRNSPSEVKLDTLLSPDLFETTPSESHPAVQPKTLDRPHDFLLTTPQGSKHEIFQPTPFSRARNMSMSPSQSPAEMTHVSAI